MRRLRWTSAVAALTVALAGCATLRQITALRRVDFSLAGVEDGRLAGVELRRIASYRDLGARDIARIALAVTRGDVPLDFRVMIRAENPAGNRTAATMVRLAWTLLLDDQPLTMARLLDAPAESDAPA